MRAFKFTVREETAIPSRSGWSVDVAAALVFAEDEAQARDLLRERNAANGIVPWEEVATVVEVPMDRAGVALLVV